MNIFVAVFLLLCSTICTSTSGSDKSPRCRPRKKQNATFYSPLGWQCYDETHGKECYPRNYYYDKKHDTCREFEHNGCGGNTNNFASLHDCMDHCKMGATDLKDGEPTTSWTRRLRELIPNCNNMTFNKRRDNGTITRFFYRHSTNNCTKVYVREGDKYFPAYRYCVHMCKAKQTRLKRCNYPMDSGSLPDGWTCKKVGSYRKCEANTNTTIGKLA